MARIGEARLVMARCGKAGMNKTKGGVIPLRELSIDIETASSADLATGGVYRYVEAPDFQILLFGYSVDDGESQVVDMACGEELPANIKAALTDPTILKTAFNAQFERVCLSRWLGLPTGEYLPPEQWRCTMVWSRYAGLPSSLKDVGMALRLTDQKMAEGANLIRFFCTPDKDGKRRLPQDAYDKWETFKRYNIRDVEVEKAIKKRLSAIPVPDLTWEDYARDQRINDRGVQLDIRLAENAVAFAEKATGEIAKELKALTGLQNPNSVQQLLRWLHSNGCGLTTLGKKEVAAELKTAEEPVKTVLALRLQAAKSSTKKFEAMLNAVCSDGRIRGVFQFYGAGRSGRFSSRIVQLQNMTKNYMDDLTECRELVKAGAYDTVKLLYGDILSVLSELVRTALIPAPGKKFLVADFSAIEARMLAWEAKEQWRIDLFRNGGDIYCQSASEMFKVPVVKHGINGHLRSRGKVAELACGYGGSVGAMKNMGALEMGLKEEELAPIVAAWREASPNIVAFWWRIDEAAKDCIINRATVQTDGYTFRYEHGCMTIELPSGRKLVYAQPRIGENRFGGESITYMGKSLTSSWERLESYGPKLVENCLGKGTLVVTDSGLKAIEHVSTSDKIWDGYEFVAHDGVVCKGEQPVMRVNGKLDATADHMILTTKGWMAVAESDGLDGAHVLLPDCCTKSRKHSRRKSTMALPLYVRNVEGSTGEASDSEKVPCEVVRVYAQSPDLGKTDDARHEYTSGVRRMAFDEAEMHGEYAQSVEELRQSRNNSLRRVATELRDILGRYGAKLQARLGLGQNRQQQRVQQRKLSLDFPQDQQQKQTNEPKSSVSREGNDGGRVSRNLRDKGKHAAVSDCAQLAYRLSVSETKLSKPVYDIRNCGPRHCFAVMCGETPLLVHNCTQANARDILCNAIKNLEDRRIVMHVHDELIIEADPDDSLEEVCEKMADTPDWADGLLLRADGYSCPFYQKD